MNNRILASMLVIGAVGAVAGGSTLALFSDTETSSNNAFAAGQIDLQVDWNETYNGEFVEEQELTDNPGAIFNISDIKPGDEGEATVSLHVSSNPAFVDMTFNQTANLENGCTEPESQVDQTCADPGQGEGELGDHLMFTVWADDGDNVLEEEENVLFNGTAEEVSQLSNGVQLDGNPDTQEIEAFQPNETEYIGVKWSVPRDTGNIIQTDSKEFEIGFIAEQARHNTPNGTAEPVNQTPTPPAGPGNETPVNMTNDTVTVNVMKHICDEDIQNLSEFKSVDGPDAGNTTEFHDTVVRCPTVVREGDSYSNGSANFGEKRDFNFEVTGADGEIQDIGGAQFQQQALNESDLGTDVNGDGDMVDTLDTSQYVYSNVSSGLVDVEETETPQDTRPGALKFTPDALVQNDDAATLVENQDTVFENDSIIELNTSKDSEDDTITLHVYNFQDDDPVNGTPPGNGTPPNGTNGSLAAISYVELCVNGTKGQGQDTCPTGERQLVKYEWNGTTFVPESDPMNTTVNAVAFKDANLTEPIEANWTSVTNLTSAVVKSATDTCEFDGGFNGTVTSCGPPPSGPPGGGLP